MKYQIKKRVYEELSEVAKVIKEKELEKKGKK